MGVSPDAERWPELPYSAWKDTCETLHLWTQIVGKIRLMQAPWLNHSWHVTLYPTTRGLTTSPIPYGGRAFQIDFDFIDHVLWVRTSDGHFRQEQARAGSRSRSSSMSCSSHCPISASTSAQVRKMPCEIVGCVPFDQDRTHASYDRDYANRFWRVLLAAHDVLTRLRTGFLGKTSPVPFFLGQLWIWRRRGFPDGGRCVIRVACRTCRTPSRARPVGLWQRGVGSASFGPAAAGRSKMRRSIRTPILRPMALPPPPSSRSRHRFPRSWANSSCLMRRCERRQIPSACLWTSFRCT